MVVLHHQSSIDYRPWRDEDEADVRHGALLRWAMHNGHLPLLRLLHAEYVLRLQFASMMQPSILDPTPLLVSEQSTDSALEYVWQTAEAEEWYIDGPRERPQPGREFETAGFDIKALIARGPRKVAFQFCHNHFR